MKKKKLSQVWIEGGYTLFAENGPDSFSVRDLANYCNLPRTNFYYYFEDKNDLINHVIDYHFQINDLFIDELQNNFDNYIPDLYEILFKFELGLKFAKQLFKNRELEKYNHAYNKGMYSSIPFLIPKFKEYFKIDLEGDELLEFWYTVSDAWYSRLHFQNCSVKYLIELCFEVMNSMKPLLANKLQEENHTSKF